MGYLDEEADLVTAILPNGSEIIVVALDSGGSQDVAAFGKLGFDHVEQAIEGMGEMVQKALSTCVPDTVEVEFGLGIKLESGKLIGLLASGSGEASLKLKLTWNNADRKPGIESSPNKQA